MTEKNRSASEDKDVILNSIGGLADAYFYHLSEIDRLRGRMSKLFVFAHKYGASDREISDKTSFSRARVQQLRVKGDGEAKGV